MIKVSFSGHLFHMRVIPFDEKMVRKIKETMGTRWNKGLKVWTMPACKPSYEILRERIGDDLLDYDESMDTFFQIFQKVPIFEVEEQFFDNLRIKPYIHQREGVDFFASRQYGAITDEMGLGKTKTFIDFVLYRKWKKILIVCPLSVIGSWEREVSSNIDMPVIKLVGDKKKRTDALLKAEDGFYIINYEGVKSMSKLLINEKFDAIMCDESTKIKNIRADRSKAAYSVADTIPNRFIATGTPISNNLVDWLGQSRLLNRCLLGTYFTLFRERYCKMGGYMDMKIIGYKNVQELKDLISLVSLRRTKKECLDLPEKIFEVRDVPMEPEQSAVYKELRDDLMSEVGGEVFSVSNALAKLTKLQEVSGGYIERTDILSDDDGLKTGENRVVRDLPCSKLNELLEISEEIDGQFIVWCRFTREIQKIYKMFMDNGILSEMFYGKTSMDERDRIVKDFQSGKFRVFIGQIDTGGLGITLTAASTVIFYSNTFELDKRLQAEDRAHRIGQKNNVVYIDLVSRGTVDAGILRALRNKKSVADMVIDSRLFKNIVLE